MPFKDVRNEGSSSRLKHSSSINKVKRIDSHKLIVAGIQSVTAMYDLRMPAVQCSHKKQKAFTSEPVVQYDISNGTSSYAHGVGLDVSTATGVLASADDTNFVSLSDTTLPGFSRSAGLPQRLATVQQQTDHPCPQIFLR